MEGQRVDTAQTGRRRPSDRLPLAVHLASSVRVVNRSPSTWQNGSVVDDRRVADNERYDRCLGLATLAHNGQEDKAGRPYMEHLLDVSRGPLGTESRLASPDSSTMSWRTRRRQRMICAERECRTR